MAEKKNFTIENYNGTDYDTLYPETNSGQVLLDAQAQRIFNLPSGDTLNNAFNHIAYGGGSYAIGDVLVTARNNLGDNWLLCNGAIVDGTKYPILKNLLKSAPTVATGKAIGVANARYKPGKAGEIIYKTSADTGIKSYNFDTSTEATEGDKVTTSFAFAYLPTKNLYVRARYVSQTNVGGTNTALYSGTDLSNMAELTKIEGATLAGIYPIEDKIFYLVQKYYPHDDKQVTWVSDATNSFPSIDTLNLMIDKSVDSFYDVTNIVKVGNNKYLELIGKKGTSSYSSIVQFFSDNLTSVFTKTGAWDMAESDGTVAIFGSNKNMEHYIVKEDSTNGSISHISLPSSNVFGTSHGFCYIGDNNNLYLSVDHANSWNVVAYDLDVGTLYSILDNPRDNKVYIIGSTATKILTFDSTDILLPVYSPTGGLRAYIKAKN